MAKDKSKPEQIDLSKEELDALQNRIKKKQLNDNDYVIFEKVLQFSMWLTIQLQNAKLSIRRLKEMVFGHKTEKKNRPFNREVQLTSQKKFTSVNCYINTSF